MSKETVKVDYLILGGGAFGLSTAYHLTISNPKASIKILDKENLPNQSAASTDINKIVRMDYGSDSTDIYSKLAESSIKTWKLWNKELGRDIYNENSCLILTGDECKPGEFEDCTVNKLKSIGYNTTWLDKDQGKSIKERLKIPNNFKKSLNFLDSWNNTNLKVGGGYFNPHGGWVNSTLGMEVLAKKCLQNGVKFCTGKSGEFKSFIEKEKGKVIGIQTQDGTLHCSKLTIVCCGAWTPAIIPELDGLVEATGHTIIKFKIPQSVRNKYSSENFPVWWYDVETKGYYGFPVNSEGIMKISNHSKGYLNPQKLSDGRVISIPKTDKNTQNLIPKVAWDHYSNHLLKAFPQMKSEGWEIDSFRMCWYADSWDNHFYFDHVPNRQGLFVATGDSGHGLKFAPEIGKVIIECIERKEGKYYNQFKWRSKPNNFKLYIDRCEVDYSSEPLYKLEWTKGSKYFESKI